MGLFGSLINVATATVKVVVTPVAVVKDLVVDGDPELTTTQDTLESAAEDIEDAVDYLFE